MPPPRAAARTRQSGSGQLITGSSAGLTLTQFHHRHSSIDGVALLHYADQLFGTRSELVRDDQGSRVRVDGIEEWAEDVRSHW